MKVYAELEATPDRGREFASAIRHLMQAWWCCMNYMLQPGRVGVAAAVGVCQCSQLRALPACCSGCLTAPQSTHPQFRSSTSAYPPNPPLRSGRMRGQRGSRAAAPRFHWSGGQPRRLPALPTPTSVGWAGLGVECAGLGW